MLDVAKTKEELQYALDTGWDRDAAIRHALEVINQLEHVVDEYKELDKNKHYSFKRDDADDWCE